MDVQKLSGLSAASANLTLRPTPRAPEESDVKAAAPEPAQSSQSPQQVKLQLDIDRTTNTVIGLVVDQATGEVVRQIPTEEMVALKARSAEVLALLDKKV